MFKNVHPGWQTVSVNTDQYSYHSGKLDPVFSPVHSFVEARSGVVDVHRVPG